jgi:hypothetical protein
MEVLKCLGIDMAKTACVLLAAEIFLKTLVSLTLAQWPVL